MLACVSSHLLDGQQQPKLPSPSRTTISRSKIELDMASMIFCRRFVLTSKADWWLHLRADASPRGDATTLWSRPTCAP